MDYVSRICCFLLFLPILSFSQKQEGKFSFSFQDTKLEHAVLDVASAFKHDLIFDPSYFDAERPVSIEILNENLTTCLERLLAASSIQHEVKEGEITLKKYRTVYGYIRNIYDHEALVGANIFDEHSLVGVSANDYGYFSLKIPYEMEELKISYIGFQDRNIDLKKEEFPMTAFLKPEEFLDQIIIVPQEVEGLLSVASEENNLLTRDIDSRLSTGGEPDINQYLYTQSGVSTGPDGIGGLHVRGGNIDQNLILLDGMRVFQPNHAFGLFSIFNTSLLNSARFSKYNFHPKHSGGVSSVVDMKLKEGSKKKWGGNVSLSTLASQLSLDGPLWKDRTSVLLSARRSHINPVLEFMSRNVELEEGEEEVNRYHFYDMNFKLSHKLNDRSSIHLSHYRGRDGFSNDYKSTFEDDYAFFQDTTDFTLNYGNTGTSLRYNHIYGKKMFSNTQGSYSTYNYTSKSVGELNFVIPEERYEDVFKHDLNFTSGVKEFSLRHDIEYFVNDKARIGFGAFYNSTIFKPGAFDDFFQALYVEEGVRELEVDEYELEASHYETHQLGLYYNHNVFFSKYFFLQAGVNYSLLSSMNKETEDESRFHLLTGRVSLRSQVSDKLGLQLTADKSQQPFHILTSSNIGFPNDIWVPAIADKAPQNAYQVNLRAIAKPNSGFTVQVSGFVKYLENLIRYPNDFSLPNLTDRFTDEWEDFTISGDGLGKGVEVDLDYENQWINLSVAYTLSRYDRAFDTLEGGLAFPFLFDQNHNFTLNVRTKLASFAYFYAQFQFNKGGRQSLWNSFAYSPFETTQDNVIESTRQGGLNEHRLPDYHRLDLGFIVELGKQGKHQLVLGVQNAYNRENIYFQYYRVRDDFFESEEDVQEGIRSISALPVLPTFRYSFSF